MKDKLIIIGAGGFGREVAWLVERINEQSPKWEIIGFIDDNESIKGTLVNGYKVLGTTSDIGDHEDAYFVCTIGASNIRKSVIERLKETYGNIKFATLIDPSAIISEKVEIGKGSIICAGTILTVNINIGEHVIINLNCTVGHDALLEDYVTLYPSVNVSGNDRIGKATEIGTGAQIIQGITITQECIIGAGAVVVDNIEVKETYAGVPARKIGR